MLGFNPFAGRQATQHMLTPPAPQIRDYGGIGIGPAGPGAPLPTWNGNQASLPTSSFLANLRSAPQVPSAGSLSNYPGTPTPIASQQPTPPPGSGMPAQWPGMNPWAQQFGAGNTMATLMGGSGGGNPYAGFFNSMAANSTPMYYGDPNQMNQTASYQGIAQHIAAARQQAMKEASGDPRQNSGQGGVPNPSPGTAGLLAGAAGLALGNPYTLPLAGGVAGGKAIWDWLSGGDDPPRYKTDPNAPPGSNARPASGGSGSGSSSGGSRPTNRN